MPEYVACVTRSIETPAGRVSGSAVPFLVADAADEADACRRAAGLFAVEYPHLADLPADARESLEIAARPVAEFDAPAPASPLSADPVRPFALGVWGDRAPTTSPTGGYRWYRRPDSGPMDGPEVLPAEVFDRLTDGEVFALVNGVRGRDYATATDATEDALTAARAAGAAGEPSSPGDSPGKA